MLMKFDGLALHASRSSLQPPILDWLDLHGECHPGRLGNLGGDPGFTLHTDDEVGKVLAIDRQNAGPPK